MAIDWVEYVKRNCDNKSIKRSDMVVIYRSLLKEMDLTSPLWAVINGYIRLRWSMSGLKWIKREAWKPEA